MEGCEFSSEIQRVLGSGNPAPWPLHCSFQKERGQGGSCGPLTYLPHLKSKGKKFKQVAPDLHSGAGNSFQVPREPPAQI